jgi:hypothetical protein
MDSEVEKTEKLILEVNKIVNDAKYVKSLTNYIFNKRALIQKATTRWLSYIRVVERCVIWHKPLTNAMMEIRNTSTAGRQRDTDWSKLQITEDECNILTQFLIVGRACKQVVESLEGSKHTTIGSLIWHHNRLRTYLSDLISRNEVHPIIHAFCKKTLDNSTLKFTAQVDKVAMISVLLDPRFKELSFLSSAEAGKCIDALKNAYTDLEVEMGEFNSITENISQAPRKKQRINKPEMWMDFTGDVLKAASPPKGKAAKQTELDRYLAHPQEDDRETDALQWWKLYGGKYPKVAALARRYLAIPASSAASERLFSQLKRTATAARQGLKPGTLCMLLFVEKHQKKIAVNCPYIQSSNVRYRTIGSGIRLLDGQWTIGIRIQSQF